MILLTVTQTPLGQVVKLPFLIEHFYKHNKLNGVSFLKFLNYHYGSDHNDADKSEDEQLPFKTVILQVIGSAIVPGILRTDYSLDFDIQTKVMLQHFYYPQQHLCNIFHPPRM